MDIKLGKLDLTKEQLERSRSLNSEFIKSFSTDASGNATVVSTRDLTQEEIESLKVSLIGLSKDPLPQEDKEQKEVERIEAGKLTGLEIVEAIESLLKGTDLEGKITPEKVIAEAKKKREK